jgi:AraC-like DNA-binding protein
VCDVDPLADVLDLGRVRGGLLASVRASAPWGLDIAAGGGAALHAITAGTAWLLVDGDPPLQLMPGDLLLLPSGIGYRLASAPDAHCRPFDRELKAELMTPAGDLTLAGPGAVTTFVCAGYDYDLDAAQQLMRLLPDVIHVPADAVAGREIAALVDLLAAEVGRRSPGSRAAAARLIDLLLIAAIRRWNETHDGPSSWLTALRDPTVAGVLALLHERPGDPWTLAALASEAHVSRATLARRFTEAVGEPPLSYLTHWRMHLAAHRLKHSTDTVETIARSVGYSSEYAFNRAFARHRGQPPGRYRRLVA